MCERVCSGGPCWARGSLLGWPLCSRARLDTFLVCSRVHSRAPQLPPQAQRWGRFCAWTACLAFLLGLSPCHSSFSFCFPWWFSFPSPAAANNHACTLTLTHTYTHTPPQAGTWPQSPFNGLSRNLGLQGLWVDHHHSH